MGKKPSDPHDGSIPSVYGEELLTVNIDQNPGELARITEEADIERNGFVPATEEGLKHLAPGCYVLIRLDDSFSWAEILAINGETVVGRLHGELSKRSRPDKHPSSRAVYFRREQIEALGCERYCWC